jgi:hypothetical protein
MRWCRKSRTGPYGRSMVMNAPFTQGLANTSFNWFDLSSGFEARLKY